MWLFISYSRKDESAVRELISDLERAHLSAWHDQELRGGDPWWQDILRRIRQCDVFVFVMSQDSLASKPCLAELSYARALGLPILPVQVGPVGTLRLTPVADLQVIDYRERTLAKGLALLDAVQESVTERGPLPDPLPKPPPVPFEYLLRLGTAIGAAQLTPDQQGDFIHQLRECLETEEDEGAKEDARELLRALRRRPDITYRNAGAVDKLLADLAPSDTDTQEIHVTEVGGDHPSPAHASAHAVGAQEQAPEPGQAPESDADVVDPDGARPFLGRRASRRWKRSGPVPRLLVIGVLLISLTALATSLLLVLSSNRTAVRAEPADTVGDYPAFVPQPADAKPGQQPKPTNETLRGDTPGLYGGTETNVCDTAAIERYLAADPKKAAAWASVRKIQTNQIHDFLQSLTPAVLRTDTAVTNHGYRDGRPTPFQSVLQAGTAVLVDQHGAPRVRCACGNPLGLPLPRPEARYEGPTWQGFSHRTVTVIRPAPKQVPHFVIVQQDTGQVVERPPGTRGEKDRPADQAEVQAAQNLPNNRPSPSSDRPSGTPGRPRGSSPGGSTPGGSTPGGY